MLYSLSDNEQTIVAAIEETCINLEMEVKLSSVIVVFLIRWKKIYKISRIYTVQFALGNEE